MGRTEKKSADDGQQDGSSEGERLKAVRDLIFGDDMIAYKREFGQIRDQIEQHQLLGKENLVSESAALNEKLDALEHSFNQSLKELKASLTATDDRLEALGRQVGANRREVGEALKTMANTFLQEPD